MPRRGYWVMLGFVRGYDEDYDGPVSETQRRLVFQARIEMLDAMRVVAAYEAGIR